MIRVYTTGSVEVVDSGTLTMWSILGRSTVRCATAWTARSGVRVPLSVHIRSASRIKTMNELPERVEEGCAPSHPAGESATAPEWPPLALGVLENMRAFPQCLLLTRVGGFYESYFEQAPELASALGIKLAARKWAGQTIPMSGFPIHQLDKYLKVLVQDRGLLVAICEEFRSAPDAPFERRVTRVVSRGTLIDERFLDPFHNNFILAASRTPQGYGIAWLDVSTADFQTAVCADDKALRDQIVRIAPREVVLGGSAWERTHIVWEAITRSNATAATVPSAPSEDAALGIHTDVTALERDAIAHLTAYLRMRLLEHMPGLHVDTSTVPPPAMHLDAATLTALEIRETHDGSARGSLVSMLRRTVTQGGTRLLTQWLTQPSTSLPLIRARHMLVEFFLQRAFARQDVRARLRVSAGDVLRTLQRISMRRSDEQDLLEIRDFIRTCDEVVARLRVEVQAAEQGGSAALRELLARCTSLAELGEQLGGAIDERVMEKRRLQQEALHNAADGVVESTPASPLPPERRARRRVSDTTLKLTEPLWGDDFEHLIRPDASPLLRALTDEYNALRRQARELENALRAAHGEPVTLKFLLGQGHVVHFPTVRGAASDELVLAYKTKTTRTYYHAAWTRIGTRLHKLADRLADREGAMLETLRQEVLAHTAMLRRNARVIDQLDVLLGFAQVAEELALVRPEVDASACLDIRGGRHLSVEVGLLEQSRLFTRNDLVLGKGATLHLITGPNMGGKSTFLRQNAIIVVMAQAGAFVPADVARIGLVDAIFSRVGAKDDLYNSRSTFMVEMNETAEILSRATSRSLVIADEIGRGTNTSVGLAIAFAVLHTLATKIQCRTLFATHYYELADMLGERGGDVPADLAQAVAFYCTTLEKRDAALWFSHRVRPGVNRASHGLDVARLAEMPTETMDLATRTHAWLERHGAAHLDTTGLVAEVLS